MDARGPSRSSLGISIQARPAGVEAVNQVYLDTACLLAQVASLVFADGIFALKGGTAINLFIRDMPRLSVDLDLVFADHRPGREEALAFISAAIRKAVGRLKAQKYGYGYGFDFLTESEACYLEAADYGTEAAAFAQQAQPSSPLRTSTVMKPKLHTWRASSPRTNSSSSTSSTLGATVKSFMLGASESCATDRR